MINDDRDAQLPCDYVVSLVMAFRAPVLAAVYLLPDPKVCLRSGPARPLTSRSSALPQWAKIAGGRRTATEVRFPSNEIDGIVLVQAEGKGRSASFGKADHDIKRMGSMASWSLAELTFQSTIPRTATVAASPSPVIRPTPISHTSGWTERPSPEVTSRSLSYCFIHGPDR